MNMRKLAALFIAAVMILSLASCAVETPEPEDEGIPENANYTYTLFDTSYVHTIDIIISEEDWADLRAHPTSKTKYKISVTIDGERLDNVSFATKGNTSLSSVATADSDRYSFKLNFSKYLKDQTYRVLDKLNLNSIYSDATYAKDYVSYLLFREVGVDGPLCSYVWVTVNGVDHGLYLAVEDIGESWTLRTNDGEMPEAPEDGVMPDMGGFNMFGGGGSGADLKYVDDDPASYPDIFNNDVTGANSADKERLIAALKALNQQTDLETYLDTDEIVRYFAAHNFVLNYDSYTGSMLHNYYLYEKDGKLAMLPWDYNLAFGGFSGGSNSTSFINTGIDSPLSGSSESSRPMWAWVVSSHKYLDAYHSACAELVQYFESGAFEAEMQRVYDMILPYVERDSSAFCTAEEFTEAFETLSLFCEKRAESYKLQLNGTLATVTSKQNAADRVDCSDVDINNTGSNFGNNKNNEQSSFGG